MLKPNYRPPVVVHRFAPHAKSIILVYNNAETGVKLKVINLEALIIRFDAHVADVIRPALRLYLIREDECQLLCSCFCTDPLTHSAFEFLSTQFSNRPLVVFLGDSLFADRQKMQEREMKNPESDGKRRIGKCGTNSHVTFRSDRDRPFVTPQRRPRVTAVVRGRGAVGTGVIFRDGSVRGPTDRRRLGWTVGRHYFDGFDRRFDRPYCGGGYFHFTGVGAI